MESPVALTFKPSVIKKSLDSLFLVAPYAGFLAAITLPGLQISMRIGGGAVGAVVAVAQLPIWSKNSNSKSYVEILESIIAALQKRSQDEIVDQQIRELGFLNDTYNLEKIILLLFKTSEGISNFEGTPLMNCTEESLDLLIKRISCIRTIHEIRNLIATQCYIGVVGIQDAGTDINNKMNEVTETSAINAINLISAISEINILSTINEIDKIN